MAPTRLRIGLLPALLLLLLAPARGADEEPVRVKARRLAAEFHEIRKSANWDEIKRRRDLIVEMGETESEGLLPVLFQAFQDDREQLCRIQAEIALGKRAPFPYLKRMVSTALTEKNDVFLMALPLALRHSRDERIGAWIVEWALPRLKPETARPAAIECLGLLHEASAREPLEKLLEKAHDVRILYETLIALARIAGPEAEGEILPFLTHEETLVRQGAVEALGEIDSPESTRRLLQVLTSVEPRVKEAAARALAARKHEAAIPALIDQLGPENGLRVRDTVRRALKDLTGEDLGVEADAWRAWLRKRDGGAAPEPGNPASRSVPTYWTVPVYSDKILFILDISGSMDAQKGPKDPRRIEQAREELVKTLDRLDRQTVFNIVAFASDPRPWQDREVPATKENVAEAKAWVEKLSVGGGTNVYDTFEQALESNRLVDTIYFLGDGSPSLGKVTEQEEILVRIRWMNRFRKIRIHTIALLTGEVPRFGGRNSPGAQGRFRSVSGDRYFDEDEAARFLRELAAQNDGAFVEIR